MFHSPFARASRVLTAASPEKKQQRVTLHCDMKQRAKVKTGAQKNAALRWEGGINVAG